MIPFEEMKYHPTAEKIVKVMQNKMQIPDALYLRVLVGYYFCLAATQMRCVVATPDSGDIPVNMYALTLAPSGYGKTRSCNMLEGEVLHLFRDRFLQETFPIMAEDNLPKLAVARANRNGTDPDDELRALTREFNVLLGPLLFSFNSGTAAAVKQMRQKLLLANAGSLNLIMDEVGANLTGNQEVFDTFIELFDKGLIKQKLIKNTSDNIRSEEIVAKTPANLLMFGVPMALLDGAKTEDDFMKMLGMGYSRRCFFGYTRKGREIIEMTPEEVLAMRTDTSNDQVMEEISLRLEALADIINANKRLAISRDTYLKLIEYQLDCQKRAHKLPEHMDIRKNEISERSFKVLKLAGAYAFIDDSAEVTEEHLYAAIKLAEDSGKAFEQLLARDKAWVKLAKYIAAVGADVTQADLAEDLPFYKGSLSQKQEMLTQAIAYGYKNNIIIKKKYEDGIEFLRGESLKETDLTAVPVAYSQDMTTGYLNESIPFDQLYKLTQAPSLHWTSHHLSNGYRNEENAIPGFSYVVIDVDGTAKLPVVKTLLQDYKALYYVTKSHTPEEHRFRVILPISHQLKLDAKDFKEFYNNLLEWLPFEADPSAAHRCKKWLTHPGHYEYTEGELLDVLPFIPKTSKNEARKILLESQQAMDNLERWMINRIGDGNRNNMLLRFAMILVDAGLSYDGVLNRVMSLNDKIADKLDQAEILGTIMMTAGKAITARP